MKADNAPQGDEDGTAAGDLFLLFRRRTLKRGLTDLTEEQGTVGRRALVATSGGAGLRLTWDGTVGILVLEISHGPSDGSVAGWMNLFRFSRRHCDLTVDDLGGSTLDSAIDYGLDLMCADGARTA